MPTKIDPSQYPTLIKAVNETYTDGLDTIRSAQVDDDNRTITMVGIDGAKQLAIKMNAKSVTVLLMDGKSPAKFAAAAPGKKKTCKPGSLSCGNACLSMYTASGKKKTCKQDPTASQVAAVNTVVQATTGKAPAAAKTPAPAPAATPPTPVPMPVPAAVTPPPAAPAPAMTPAQKAAATRKLKAQAVVDLQKKSNEYANAIALKIKAQDAHQNAIAYLDTLKANKVKPKKADNQMLVDAKNLLDQAAQGEADAKAALDKAQSHHDALHPNKKSKSKSAPAKSAPPAAPTADNPFGYAGAAPLNLIKDGMPGSQTQSAGHTKAEVTLLENEHDPWQNAKIDRIMKAGAGITRSEAQGLSHFIGTDFKGMNSMFYDPNWNKGLSAWKEAALVAKVKGAAAALAKLPAITKDAIDKAAKSPKANLNGKGAPWKTDYLIHHMKIDGNAALKGIVDEYKKSAGQGVPVEAGKLMSTTWREGGDPNFAPGANVELRIKPRLDGKGQGKLVDKFKNSVWENEVTYHPKTRFKVTEIDESQSQKTPDVYRDQKFYKFGDAKNLTLQYLAKSALDNNYDALYKQKVFAGNSGIVDPVLASLGINKPKTNDEFLAAADALFAELGKRAKTAKIGSYKERILAQKGSSGKTIIHLEEL